MLADGGVSSRGSPWSCRSWAGPHDTPTQGIEDPRHEVEAHKHGHPAGGPQAPRLQGVTLLFSTEHLLQDKVGRGCCVSDRALICLPSWPFLNRPEREGPPPSKAIWHSRRKQTRLAVQVPHVWNGPRPLGGSGDGHVCRPGPTGMLLHGSVALDIHLPGFGGTLLSLFPPSVLTAPTAPPGVLSVKSTAGSSPEIPPTALAPISQHASNLKLQLWPFLGHP